MKDAKALGRKSSRHSLCLIAAALLTAIACAPKGELSRTLHPPHKKYLDRLAPATAASVKTALSEEIQQLSKGIPDACKLENTNSPSTSLCMHCESESWKVERCYSFKGKIDSNTDCQHNSEIIKCLTKAPPFALYLDWHSSHEKFLRENFLVWKESVHQIWDDKLAGDEREESARIITSLDWLTKKLTAERSLESSDGEIFAKALGLEADQFKKSQDFLLATQSSRLAGKLNLSLLLQKTNEFYTETHGPSSIWEDLRSMSLEGLDD